MKIGAGSTPCLTKARVNTPLHTPAVGKTLVGATSGSPATEERTRPATHAGVYVRRVGERFCNTV